MGGWDGEMCHFLPRELCYMLSCSFQFCKIRKSCVYVYAYIYICIYICTHIHITYLGIVLRVIRWKWHKMLLQMLFVKYLYLNWYSLQKALYYFAHCLPGPCSRSTKISFAYLFSNNCLGFVRTRTGRNSSKRKLLFVSVKSCIKCPLILCC